jgi:hypothetical protein
VTLNLANIVAGAMRTVTSLGLSGRATIVRPPTINGETGATSGSTLTQTVDAVEMGPAELGAQPGESWRRATLGLMVEVAQLSWYLELADRVTWAGTTYQVVSLTPTAPTGDALLVSIGLAL